MNSKITDLSAADLAIICAGLAKADVLFRAYPTGSTFCVEITGY